MTKKEFLKLKIEDPRCNGDHWHNEDIDLFLSGIKRSAISKKIQGFIADEMKNRNMRWIHQAFQMGELKKLRVICTAKTKKTQEKRIMRYVQLLMKSYYGYLLNRSKIEKFNSMFNLKLEEF